jgi:hypothetical protein
MESQMFHPGVKTQLCARLSCKKAFLKLPLHKILTLTRLGSLGLPGDTVRRYNRPVGIFFRRTIGSMDTRKNYLRFIGFVVSLIVVSVASAQVGPQPLAFETLGKHIYSGHRQKQNYVITSREEWQSLWELVHTNVIPKPDLPEVDFTERVIIGVFQGEQASGGFDITVTDLVKNGKKLTAKVTEMTPGGSCAVTTALTQPYHIIVTDRMRKVKFKVKREIKECQ